MRTVELVVAALFILAGLRSLWSWSRRRFDGADVVDHLLYALYLTGRIGLWFSIAGVFLISASIDVEGRAFLDEFARYRWYIMVPLLLSAVQFLAGYALGRRSPDEPPGGHMS
jgi:hypothetical protein